MIKKQVVCLLLALTITSAHAYVDKQQVLDIFKATAQGFGAGLLSAWVVDGARANALPDLTRFRLYDTYGICRDQLAGQIKVAIGYGAATAFIGHKNWVARMVGVLLGTHGAVIIKK